MDYMRESRLRLLSTFFLFLYHGEFDISRNKLLDLIKLADRKGHDICIAQMFANKNDRPLLDTRELIENSFSHLSIVLTFVYIYQLINHY